MTYCSDNRPDVTAYHLLLCLLFHIYALLSGNVLDCVPPAFFAAAEADCSLFARHCRYFDKYVDMWVNDYDASVFRVMPNILDTLVPSIGQAKGVARLGRQRQQRGAGSSFPFPRPVLYNFVLMIQRYSATFNSFA